jgi:hypothetical protein
MLHLWQTTSSTHGFFFFLRTGGTKSPYWNTLKRKANNSDKEETESILKGLGKGLARMVTSSNQKKRKKKKKMQGG